VDGFILGPAPVIGAAIVWGGRNLVKMDRLQDALEAAGVEFTNGDQPGVRLTKVAAAHSVEPAKNQRLPGKQPTAKPPRRLRRCDRPWLDRPLSWLA
jgi:hypothetical protein